MSASQGRTEIGKCVLRTHGSKIRFFPNFDAAINSLPGSNSEQQEEVVRPRMEVPFTNAADSVPGCAESQNPSANKPGTAVAEPKPAQGAPISKIQEDEPSRDGDAGEAAASAAAPYMKRKVALYVAYIGAGYSVSPLHPRYISYHVSQHQSMHIQLCRYHIGKGHLLCRTIPYHSHP